MCLYGRILVTIILILKLFNMTTQSEFWEISKQDDSSTEHWLPSNFYSAINHQYLIYYRRGDFYLLRNYVFEKAKYDK